MSISHFFKAIKVRLVQVDPSSEAEIRVEDVKDEVFDMARPADPNFITFADLLASGQGDVIMSLLVDFRAFFEYDQREYANQMNYDDGDSVMPPDFPDYDNLLGELPEGVPQDMKPLPVSMKPE